MNTDSARHKPLSLRIIEANVVATPQQRLAYALDTLRTLQDRNLVAIRSDNPSRSQHELLMKHDFLEEVLKGWYIPAEAGAGESKAWYTSS